MDETTFRLTLRQQALHTLQLLTLLEEIDNHIAAEGLKTDHWKLVREKIKAAKGFVVIDQSLLAEPSTTFKG
jgi:hypothetical protein